MLLRLGASKLFLARASRPKQTFTKALAELLFRALSSGQSEQATPASLDERSPDDFYDNYPRVCQYFETFGDVNIFEQRSCPTRREQFRSLEELLVHVEGKYEDFWSDADVFDREEEEKE